jgi:hypothetical protein
MIQRGLTTSLDITIYDDDGQTVLPPTAARISVYAGSITEPIIDDVVAVHAATSTYSLLAAATVDEALSAEWQEHWTLTIDGSAHEFRRTIYLCRTVPVATLIDADLEDYHADILDHVEPGTTTLEGYRAKAWAKIEKALIRRGRRPELVLDGWELTGAHAYKTLEIFFRDSAQSVGDERWKELSIEYRDMFDEDWRNINFNYDADEDGRVDEDQNLAARGVIWLTG